MNKIGFLAGSFDIIHPGYIKLFKDAKSVCDWLILGLHNDPSIERPNTKIKPVHTIKERYEILRSIKYIDSILIYNTEDDLYRILTTNNIDIRIMGSDYEGKDFTGKDLNMEVYYHKRDHKYSTTRLKNMIIETGFYNEQN